MRHDVIAVRVGAQARGRLIPCPARASRRESRLDFARAAPDFEHGGAGRIGGVASTRRAARHNGWDLAVQSIKHGMIGLTVSLAVEPEPSGVIVDCICPGPVNTGMTAAIPTPRPDGVRGRQTVLRRYGGPGEVAQMTLSPRPPAASSITRAVVVVDGG